MIRNGAPYSNRKPAVRSLVDVFRARARGVDTQTIRAEERLQIARTRAKIEQSRAQRRLLLALACAAGVYAVIAAKMTLLAFSDPIGQSSTYSPPQINEVRANIVDRNGELLATNLPGYSLYAEPDNMIDPIAAAAAIATLFPEHARETLEAKFSNAELEFMWIRKQISPEQRRAVLELGEPGLKFGSRQLRLFPNGAVAAHLLGGVNVGEMGVHAAEMKGQAGIEFSFEDYLANPENADRPLKLSVDLSVQDALENVLRQGVHLYQAKGASAVLLEADSGRVLALSSMPDFDPNLRPTQAEIATGNDPSVSPRFNRAALGTYELGSTFKVFTAALAIETGYANSNTIVPVGRSIQSGKYLIKDFHYYGEELTLADVIVKSSNVGTARIAKALGADQQREFLGELGFFEPSPLELAEARRARPQFPTPETWGEISTMTISYGHGLSTTPVHLAAAYATMVNGGYKVTPTLLQDRPQLSERQQIIRNDTSVAIRQMLRDVVVADHGTAKAARTEGYDIGGKTGTAEKLDPNGGYYKDRNINTFAGAFPMSDPKYVIVVTLDEPVNPFGNDDQQTAGWTVVPVTAEIVKRISPLLDLRPVYTPDLPIE